MKTITDPKIHELKIASVFIDQEDIVHSVAKKVPFTLENTKEYVEFLKRLLKGKKAYMLSEHSQAGCFSDEARDYLKRESARLYRAIAIASRTPTGSVSGTIVTLLMPPTIPAKLFNNTQEAREWLMQLKKNEKN